MQATVRPARNGIYKSAASGEINFNADLARPILDSISMQWEVLFGSTIISCLKYVLPASYYYTVSVKCTFVSSSLLRGKCGGGLPTLTL